MSVTYTKLVDRHPVRKSIDKINELLGAPADGWSQDPEIELAKSEYISELLTLYISSGMDDDDRFYIFSFLCACFEVAIVEDGLDIEDDWRSAASLISDRVNLHAATLAYWSCYEADDPDDPEQMTVISMRVREVWDKYQAEYL